MELKAGFTGAGKVGCALGRYIVENTARDTSESGYAARESIRVMGYYSLHKDSSQSAAEFTGTRAYDSLKELVDECDMIFVTVPDGAISSVYSEIARHDIKGKTICHCSGAMSAAEAFEGIGQTGASGYSIHPLFAVSDRFSAHSELTGVFFTLEGEDAMDGGSAAFRTFKESLEKWGNPVRMIKAEDKVKYHCGAAAASNLVCGLVEKSIKLFEQCGFSEEDAVRALAPILEGNMKHIAEKGPVESLTGPVERNDWRTVEKHLDCLGNADERELYRLLSLELVDMAQRKHPDRHYSYLRRMLRKGE